jgi:thiamine phosphate synthase YjbQ (UPF0047 family)
MRAHTEYLTFHTEKKRELVHLTPMLEPILAKSGVTSGSGWRSSRPRGPPIATT